ncbi:D-glycero-alpha-D-manno-heptose-1,7-bisphosphate 7-phosphatase, partial [Micromonospora sp. CPCC 206061]|uniref:D-glycero-alpha-D-manno-heptose-1,7-bisphosphate 7-phosphatase n=1 Tax=Micromonospora sp. CPCC 206061 TaxID=3122410 RepID=UPI002FF19F8A
MPHPARSMPRPPRLAVLDRDGVLNVNRHDHVTRPDQWVWIPGSRTACARLAAAGVAIAVVTNQAAVGRGLIDETTLSRIHARLVGDLAGLSVPAPLLLHCPHPPAWRCACRKPRPGMVLAALRHYGVAPADAVMVGDHVTDVAAGAAAGCWSLHLRSGRGAPPRRPPAGYLGSAPDLAAAVSRLLATSPAGRAGAGR